MQITRGKITRAQKIVIYGPEGIGKSTFAAAFPNPVFIDTEGSTNHMDVARLPRPSSWTMLLEQVRYIRQHPETCGTLVIDTADWAEQLCVTEICAKSQKAGIEDFGYGKGYVYLAEEFGKLLNLLEEIVDRGIHVVLTAHAKMRRFEQPDELGGYDRWEMKVGKNTAPLVKEWADMLLFANYKTYVINVDNQGAQKGRNKAQGGARIMYTSHHPCWDAKNRHNLPEEIPLEFAAIAHCLAVAGITSAAAVTETPATEPEQAPPPKPAPENDRTVLPFPSQAPEPPSSPAAPVPEEPPLDDGIPRALKDLMLQSGVTETEIQEAVAFRGYFPRGTPIVNYGDAFIQGVLISAWPDVYQMILGMRKDNEATPF